MPFVAFAEMANPEDPAGDLAEAGAKRDIEFLQDDLAEAISIVPFRHDHGREHERSLGRRFVQQFQPPGIDGCVAGRRQPPVSGKYVGKPFLAQHH
jgi:hypothetical protein